MSHTPVNQAPSLIVLSGGLDSAANLALAARDGIAALAMTVRYGQRAEAREVEASTRLSRHFGVKHLVLDASWLGDLGGSSLTDSSQSVPSLAHDKLDDLTAARQTAKSVWIPNRNGVFIQIAAAVAERNGLSQLLLGFNREEAVTFPDNSAEFMERSTRALELSTANHVKVGSYTVALDKREIVATLRTLKDPFPFEELWSCYHAGERPCGACESCARLNRALGRPGPAAGEERK